MPNTDPAAATGLPNEDNPPSVEELAALNFEPWVDEAGDWKPPLSPADWQRFNKEGGIGIRVAWKVLHQTKQQLMNSTFEKDGDQERHLGEIMADLISNSKLELEAIKTVLETAELRILCAMATRGLEEIDAAEGDANG
jgi:hypothetical protein